MPHPSVLRRCLCCSCTSLTSSNSRESRRGLNSKLRPLIHLSVQKKVDSPLPKWCTVAAWKSAITARSQDTGALPLVLSFQTHRTRSAKPAFLRSVMPSPPTLSDDTVSQATLDVPRVLLVATTIPSSQPYMHHFPSRGV